MTYVLIGAEVVKAIGLSIAFIGVMISIITIGLSYLIYRLSKKKCREYLKMTGLITAWAVFLWLNAQTSFELGYKAYFGVYSIAHLISIIIGSATIIAFLFILPKLFKFFDKKLLIIAGIFAVLGLLLRIINPFFGLIYLSLLQKIFIIIPSLLGFFMIIKSYLRRKE